MDQRTLLLGLFVLSVILSALFFAVPFCYPEGTFVYLDGSPAHMDHDWSSFGLGGLVYALGDFLCHQSFSRSIILNGSQMPICIRDIGLLIGFVIGLVYCLKVSEKVLDRKHLFAGIILLLLTLLEWICERAFHVDMPEIRMILAIVSGIGAAIIVAWAAYRSTAGPEALH